MADPFTSALVSDVVGRLTSTAIDEYGLLRRLKNDLSALENTFKLIQEVENVLDDAKTEAMIQRLHGEMGKKYKISAFFTSLYNPLMVKTRIAHKVKNIREKLEDIKANKSNFQLTSTNIREDAAGIGSEILKRETSSLINLSKIYGREEAKERWIVKDLYQDYWHDMDVDDVQVYAIWGIGGIGKTTLAQYVYNHETVKTHFDLKCWVYISAVFDINRITKLIIKAIYGPENALKLNDMSLDDLKIQLQNKLKGKKYFIIIDDVVESATDSSSLTKPIQKIQVVLVDIPENLAENDNIVAEHGLSLEITQSPGGSSDTSEGSENNGSFKNSGRSNEEYSEDEASSKEGGFKTPHVQRSIRESRAPVRYSPSANYLLLTENGEPESYSEALGFKKSRMTEKAAGAFLCSDMAELNKPKGQLPLVFEMKDRCSKKHVLSYVFTVGVTTVEWESRLQKNSWNEEPCSDVHQVDDEREIEVLHSFNWPPRGLITEEGVLPERGYSQLNDVSSGYLVAQPQVNPDSTIAQVRYTLTNLWIKNKDMEETWNKLCKALSCGAKGSTIMVTTRDKDTAQLLAKTPELQHDVAHLSKEESWSLFKMLAFPGGGEGENVRELELVGREIAEKCEGLPLAVKTMDNGILPSLRLRYDDLLPQLRRCFAYCCVFSKGEEMSKDLLIELWMANGFIDRYVLGEKILSCLVQRLFFQDVVQEGYELYTGEKCKMHDLMHDLAKYEMGNDCAVIAPGKELIILDEVLHLSLSCHDFEFSKQDLRKLRSVQSMLVFNQDYESSIRQISSHVYVRVLYLTLFKSSTLPKSICKLIHLRYLKISGSQIEVLPESIINLQNLQVLIIQSCWDFRELPKGLKYMRNLQHLDTQYTTLTHMPVGIKELTNLRRLQEFVIGKDDGAQIGELGNLNLLGWELNLSRLENVSGLSDAESAKLKDKTNLKSLILNWSGDRSEIFDSDVLEGLEPNSSLQRLIIFYYMGTFLSPSWLVNLVDLTCIQFIHLEKCKHLPPLGKLPSLKIIQLSYMHSLKCFHDDDILTKDEILFPNLQMLNIYACSSLVYLPSNFPKLRSLKIGGCDELRSLPDEIQSFKDLNQIAIKDCEIISRRCEKEIGKDWLKISHIPHLDIQTPRWPFKVGSLEDIPNLLYSMDGIGWL
ncbi:disease resistance protein [Tanacetum coccineum]